MYIVELNGMTVHCSDKYSDAVAAYNDYTDHIAKRGDFVTIWYIKDMGMSIYKDKNAKLLTANRKKKSEYATLLSGYKK